MSEICPERLESVFTLAGFDGRWSYLTKLLQNLHACQGRSLRLDRNWVLTAQNFSCPLCRQNKVSLVDKRPDGLDAILHCDHDHIADYVAEKAKANSIACDIRPLVAKYSSYQPTIICRACNWIDSHIKRQFGEIPADFSFPLLSKSRLINIPGKKRHKLYKEKAWKEWQSQKSNFLARQLNISRDLFDLKGIQGKFIGARAKKYIYETAYVKFSQACDRHSLSLSFDVFLRHSVQWQKSNVES